MTITDIVYVVNCCILIAERMDTSVYEISPVLSGIPGSPERTVRVNALVRIFRFVMKQSYICALIAMMVSSYELQCLAFS